MKLKDTENKGKMHCKQITGLIKCINFESDQLESWWLRIRITSLISKGNAELQSLVSKNCIQLKEYNRKVLNHPRILLHGQVVEFLELKFGFVIPGSTNSWD